MDLALHDTYGTLIDTVGAVLLGIGKFTIVIPDGDDVVLCFTFIGKKRKEVKYTGQQMMKVIMEDESQELEEVVIVNQGYQKIDKRELTSAVCLV